MLTFLSFYSFHFTCFTSVIPSSVIYEHFKQQRGGDYVNIILKLQNTQVHLVKIKLCCRGLDNGAPILIANRKSCASPSLCSLDCLTNPLHPNHLPLSLRGINITTPRVGHESIRTGMLYVLPKLPAC